MEVIVQWTDPTRGVDSYRSGYADGDELMTCRMGPFGEAGAWCVAVADHESGDVLARLAVCDDPVVADLEGYMLWLGSCCEAVIADGRSLYEAPGRDDWGV